jgi:hypothetical protein|tara:strand:+ start:376 stop:564 length:189 start_codon:yes stop_codon:yes gene_type:complete
MLVVAVVQPIKGVLLVVADQAEVRLEKHKAVMLIVEQIILAEAEVVLKGNQLVKAVMVVLVL